MIPKSMIKKLGVDAISKMAPLIQEIMDKLNTIDQKIDKIIEEKCKDEPETKNNTENNPTDTD